MTDTEKDAPETIPGQSFHNEALTGSGTINRDGTYGPPLPDPTEVRGLGPDKTSGGRTVAVSGDMERTGPSTSEDPLTRAQASSAPGKDEDTGEREDADFTSGPAATTAPKKTTPPPATGKK